ALTRQRRPEDARIKTEAEIAEERAKAAAGYGDIPQARRAEESLAIQRQYAAQSAAGGGGGKPPTAEQVESDIRAERDRIYGTWLAGRMAMVGKPAEWYQATEPGGKKSVKRFDADARREYKFKYGTEALQGPPSDAEKAARLAEAERQARAIVNSRFRAAPSVRGGGGALAPGDYHYD